MLTFPEGRETLPGASTRPVYDFGVVAAAATERLAELQPPASPDELVAIHGMLNQIHPATPDESCLRFNSVAADGRGGSPVSTSERYRLLNQFLHSFRLG